LAEFGVGGWMVNPALRVFRESSVVVENDNWAGSDVAAAAQVVGAFPLVAGSADAAVVLELQPGLYTAHAFSPGGAVGVALTEVYVVDGAGTLANVSARAGVGTGADLLVVGCVVGGDAAVPLLVRGVGPGLAAFGVEGVLARPRLSFFRGPLETLVNRSWTEAPDPGLLASAAVATGAFPLARAPGDAALRVTAQPGIYTVQLRGLGAGGASPLGVGLVELYAVP
jgi:hypothetical protein